MGNTPKVQSGDNIPGYLKKLPWSLDGNLSWANISGKHRTSWLGLGRKPRNQNLLNPSPSAMGTVQGWCTALRRPHVIHHVVIWWLRWTQNGGESSWVSESRQICRKDKQLLTPLLERQKEPVSWSGWGLWWRGNKRKLVKVLLVGSSALCVPFLRGPGTISLPGGEEGDRNAAVSTRRCISRQAFPICFAHTSSHRQRK